MPDFAPREPLPLRITRGLSHVLPRGRSALIRRVAGALGYKTPFVARVGDLRLLIDLTERVSRTLYLFDAFEPHVTRLLGALLALGQTMLDVGANFGYFSLLAARRVGPQGKIIAFEPDPRNIQRLTTNIALNFPPPSTLIEVVPMALFDRPGTLPFFLATQDEDNLGTSSLLEQNAAGQDTGSAPKRTRIDVQATTLDDFLGARNLLRLGAIDLVKMDIEGGEWGALHGAAKALEQKAIRRLLLELHVETLGQEKSAALIDFMSGHGYLAWFVRESAALEHPNPTVGIAGVEPYDAAQLAHTNPHFLFTHS